MITSLRYPLIIPHADHTGPYSAAVCTGRTVAACHLDTGACEKIKVLGASEFTISVVLTSLGVDGAVGLRSGETHTLADEPTAFPQAVVMLLGKRLRRGNLSRKARQIAVAHHEWETTIKYHHKEFINLAIGKASVESTRGAR